MGTVLVPPADPTRAPAKDCEFRIHRFDPVAWRWVTEELHGYLRTPDFSTAHMLSSDRLLAISSDPGGFRDGSRRYPFAIYRRNDKGTFVLDHFEDLGLEKPALGGQGNWNYPFLQHLWLRAKVAWCGSHTFVVSPTGHFWCFNAKGRLRRAYNTFDIEDKVARQQALWTGGLLGFQPTASGELLVSGLSADAIARGVAYQQQLRASPRSVEAQDAATQQQYEALLAQGQVVRWFFLDPEASLPRPVASPQNLPTVVSSLQDCLDFNWVLKPDGNLQMYSFREMQRSR